METTEPIESDATQVLLSMAYDVAFELYDHHNPANVNPLAVLAMHPMEQYHEISGLYRAIERYERQGVKEHYGLSLTDYLDLPRDMIDMITRRAMARTEEMTRAQAAAEEKARRESSRDTS